MSRKLAWTLAILIMISLCIGETFFLMAVLGKGNEQPFGMIIGGVIGWFTPAITRGLEKVNA